MKLQKLFLVRGVEQLCKALLVSMVVILTSAAAQAQNQGNNWVFGNHAGLNFPIGGGPPVSFGGAAISTQEGSATMSDQNGNLLFYTDGRTVWNKNNAVMPNGTGLLGGSSATQSALIVPLPCSECTTYLVFAVNEMLPQKQQTLSYSVVDMNLSGGLGAVTTKNTILRTAVSEKLAAVKGSSGNDFFFVAHGFSQSTIAVNNQFYVYHITCGTNGVNLVGTETTYAVGSPHQNGANTQHPSAGQMQINPAGTLIACAVNTAFVEILNFNSTTGAITQGPPRTYSASSPPFQHSSTYGLSFSPNSGFLYVSTLVAPSRLFQLDISTSTWNTTPLAVGSSTGYDIGQLQLGPDKKIYVARSGNAFISVINSPDFAACAFQSNGATLSSGATCQLGLPTTIAGDFSCTGTNPPGRDCDFAVTPACPGQASTFTDLSANATSWSWDFGDGSPLSSLSNPSHVYSSSGPFTVTLIVNGGCKVVKSIALPAAPSPPIITGPTTTCQSGTYSVVLPPSVTANWTVTNGTPTSGSGSSITVNWNPGANGLVAVTLTNNKTCCSVTNQLFVRACDTASECCKDVKLSVVKKNLVAQGAGLYTFTPTLTVLSGMGNITKVTATVISTSITFVPGNCGISGAASSYVPNPATAPAGFSSSLPVPFSTEVVWTTSGAGVSLSGGVDFPFDIKFPPAPGSITCHDLLSFCVKFTITDEKCNSCQIIQCYGPIKRSGGAD